MRILLIGGSGFFGKSLLHLLQRVEGVLQPGSEVIFASRHPNPLMRAPFEFHGVKVSNLYYDVLSGANLPDCNVVIHAAASSNASRYVVAADAETQTIVEGTRRLLDLMKGLGPQTKLIYLSSGAVYGRQPKLSQTLAEDSPFESRLDPTKAAYAIAKRDAELAVVHYAKFHDRPAIIARCFAFVGAFLPTDTHFAIGNMIADIEGRRPISIHARHLVYRSYLSTDDLWICLLKMALATEFRGEAFNVGCGRGVELHDLAVRLGVRFGVGYSGSSRLELENSHEDFYIPDVTKSIETFNLPRPSELVDTVSDILKQRADLGLNRR